VPQPRPKSADSVTRPGRNDLCSCGSGKKYKKCCGERRDPPPQAQPPESTRAVGPNTPPPAEFGFLEALESSGRYAELEQSVRRCLADDRGTAFSGKCALSLWKQGKDALEALQRAAHLRLERLERLSASAPRVVDKMSSNFLHLGLIHACLPNARIIHMQRNGIDTCLPIYFQSFPESHRYASDLEDLVHDYGEYLRVMEHWKRILPQEAILEVPYEQLVDGQEAWTRRMLEFAGLSFDPRLDFHETERTVTTASKWQVRQKMSRSSIGRWRNYREFIAPLLQLAPLQEER
jgi:Sulfotransferase family/SEC-C motif